MAAAAVLAREAKWPADSFEKTVLAELAAFLPVILGGGERKPQQVCRGREQTAAHAQTEQGAFE